MQNSLNIILQQPGGGFGFDPNLLIIGIFVIMYFFMILPQQRRNKAQKKFREEIQKGDKIVTLSGIHGKINKLDDTTMVIEVESGAEIKMERVMIDVERTKLLNPEKWGPKKK